MFYWFGLDYLFIIESFFEVRGNGIVWLDLGFVIYGGLSGKGVLIF